MEKIIKFLPVMAILLGSGLAVAGHVSYNAPNVKNVNSGTGTPEWEPLEPGENIFCDLNPERQCLAHQIDSTTVVDIIYGYVE